MTPLAEEPLVSCLMVTLPVPDRWAGFKRSIADYLRQTHQMRELVIVTDPRVAAGGTTEAIRDYVTGLSRSDIRVVTPAAASLGALRNVSVAEARGELLCTWDDDDLHHPERLSRQVAALVDADAEALCLKHMMQFFPAERRLYCTNWGVTPYLGVPASLVCRRDAPIEYPEAGPFADRGEDTVVINQLLARGRLHALENEPHLYVYISHGKNIGSVEHHRSLLQLAVSRGLLRRRELALRAGLAAHDFGPGAVTVEGANGPAFVIG